MWHRELPPEADEVWDIIAKALMLRAGGTIALSPDELRQAAGVQAELDFLNDGSLALRVERN